VKLNQQTIITFLIGLSAGAVFFGGSNESKSETNSVSPSQASSEPRLSHTVEMNNATQSEPIKLVGDYKVEWESFAGDCLKTDVSLKAAWDTDFYHYGTVFNVDGYGKGTSYFYTLDNGNYYLEPNGIWSDTCSWKATFTPIDLP
jgi:hypothetical protein